jgi:hypothetical protein
MLVCNLLQTSPFYCPRDQVLRAGSAVPIKLDFIRNFGECGAAGLRNAWPKPLFPGFAAGRFAVALNVQYSTALTSRNARGGRLSCRNERNKILVSRSSYPFIMARQPSVRALTRFLPAGLAASKSSWSRMAVPTAQAGS